MRRSQNAGKAILKVGKSFLAYLLCCIISISPLLICFVSLAIHESIDNGQSAARASARAEEYLQTKYPEESFTLVSDSYFFEEDYYTFHFESVDGKHLTVYVYNSSIKSTLE